MTMWIIFGYILPAAVFFVLGCWDEIDCGDELTSVAFLFFLLGAIIPVINWLSMLSILNHLNKKHDLINWDFVIYRRKK